MIFLMEKYKSVTVKHDFSKWKKPIGDWIWFFQMDKTPIEYRIAISRKKTL